MWESGDVISFVQRSTTCPSPRPWRCSRKELAGITLHYEEGGARVRTEGRAKRQRRLLDAHRVAEEFYCNSWAVMKPTRVASSWLARLPTRRCASISGVSYARPRGILTRLRSKATDQNPGRGRRATGSRGIYDRFRGRLV